MPRILIAGCGYVGEATADLFHSAGWEVEGWVHSQESAARLSAKPYQVGLVDISQRDEIDEQKEALDAVIHCESFSGGDGVAYCVIYFDGKVLLVNNILPAKQHD